MQLVYVVYYTEHYVFNVRYTFFQANKFLSTSEAVSLAKKAVSEVYNRTDTITAVTCSDGAYVHVGNGEFQYFGE